MKRIEFGLSEDNEKELRKEAIKEACEDAKSKADTIASGLGLELVRVSAVRESGVYVEPYRGGRFDYAIPIPTLKWILISIATLTGLSLMFLNLEQYIKDWKSFFNFREAFLMDEKMTDYIGVKKIENNLAYIKKKKKTQRIKIIKVKPINLKIKNQKERQK